ncbi:hypothetical protein D9M72_510070 [compost metagenome]
MAVLIGIAIDTRLVLKHRHQPLLRILLFHEVFAFRPLDLARHEDLQAGAQRIVLERIFRPEQFKLDAQPGADIGPGGGRLDHQFVTVVVFERHRGAGKIFRRPVAVVHFVAEALAQLFGIIGPRPFEVGDGAVDGLDFQ